jgi:hypothetical protein
MKKVLVFVLCLLPLSVFAAGVEPDVHPVFLNGKPFSHAVLINGIWAIPLQDIARGAGTDKTFEQFQVQASTLRVRTAPGAHKYGNIVLKRGVASSTTGGSGPVPLFIVNRDAQVSVNVLTHDGVAFVPLPDFAHAFGGVWTAPVGKVAPGAPFQLNFAKNPNAILIGL